MSNSISSISTQKNFFVMSSKVERFQFSSRYPNMQHLRKCPSSRTDFMGIEIVVIMDHFQHFKNVQQSKMAQCVPSDFLKFTLLVEEGQLTQARVDIDCKVQTNTPTSSSNMVEYQQSAPNHHQYSHLGTKIKPLIHALITTQCKISKYSDMHQH